MGQPLLATVSPRVCWSPDGRALAVGTRSVSVWRIEDPNHLEATAKGLLKVAAQRAVSSRLQVAYLYSELGSYGRSAAKKRVERVRNAILHHPQEYRLRASIFENLGEPKWAAADTAKAKRLQAD